MKYKLAGVEWNRADLYQSVAFAAAVRAQHAAVVTFLPAGCAHASKVQVGDMSVGQITWPADPLLEPKAAEAEFLSSFGSWLESLPIDE